MQGDSDARLLLLPRDGVVASATGIGIFARTAGDNVILVLGDIPSANSLTGLSFIHESRGIKRVGYRFRPDRALTTLLLLDARLLRLESVAKVVGSLVKEGHEPSLKIVPLSLPASELYVEPRLLLRPEPCELHGDGSVETGETAVINPSKLCLRAGAAMYSLGFQVAGRPVTVVSLPSPSLSLFELLLRDSGSSIMVLSCLPRPCREGTMYAVDGKTSIV